MPHEFTDMQEVSWAARFRVAHREASATGGLPVTSSVRRLDALYTGTVYLYRGGRWRSWYQNSYFHNLAAAVQHLRQQGITIATVEEALGATAPRPHTRARVRGLAHGVQQAARAAIARTLRSCPEARFRKKLERWRLSIFPRIRAMRATRVVPRLRRLVPPRVAAAVLRTWFNGWCTKRRFQGRSKCIFGCTYGEDAVDHYMSCTCLYRHGTTRLLLPPAADFFDRGTSFMLLDSKAALPDDVLTKRALLLAAAYRLHCRYRREVGFADDEVRRRALDQAVKEAALGHAGAVRLLDGLWASSASSSTC